MMPGVGATGGTEGGTASLPTGIPDGNKPAGASSLLVEAAVLPPSWVADSPRRSAAAAADDDSCAADVDGVKVVAAVGGKDTEGALAAWLNGGSGMVGGKGGWFAMRSMQTGQ